MFSIPIELTSLSDRMTFRRAFCGSQNVHETAELHIKMQKEIQVKSSLSLCLSLIRLKIMTGALLLVSYPGVQDTTTRNETCKQYK